MLDPAGYRRLGREPRASSRRLTCKRRCSSQRYVSCCYVKKVRIETASQLMLASVTLQRQKTEASRALVLKSRVPKSQCWCFVGLPLTDCRSCTRKGVLSKEEIERARTHIVREHVEVRDRPAAIERWASSWSSSFFLVL